METLLLLNCPNKEYKIEINTIIAKYGNKDIVSLNIIDIKYEKKFSCWFIFSPYINDLTNFKKELDPNIFFSLSFKFSVIFSSLEKSISFNWFSILSTNSDSISWVKKTLFLHKACITKTLLTFISLSDFKFLTFNINIKNKIETNNITQIAILNILVINFLFFLKLNNKMFTSYL